MAQDAAAQTDAGDVAGAGEAPEQLPWGEQAALLRIEEQEGTMADLRATNEVRKICQVGVVKWEVRILD